MTCGTVPSPNFFESNNLRNQSLFAQHEDLAERTTLQAMMASPMRLTRGLQRPCQALRSQQQTLLRQGCLRRSFMSTRCLKQPRPYPQPSAAISSAPTTVSSSFLRTFMASAPQLKTSKRAHNNEPIPDGPPTTDFSRMDMLSQAPAPSTSVDICSSDGFKLNSGVSIYDGKGVVLLGGEAFEWQPWGTDKRLVNKKGQWEVPEAAFGMFDLVWPRPGTSTSSLKMHCYSSRIADCE